MFKIDALNLSEKKFKGVEPVIHPTAIIRDCQFGEYTEVMEFTHLEETTLDDYSYICPNVQVIYTDIGKFSNIASMCRINPGFHPMERPSLHHFTYRMEEFGFAMKDDEEYFHWRRLQKVIIGHDTWIGHGVVIMPGVKIGHGAVIGSNSVVTKDISPYSIAVGSPAKVVRKRFQKEISDALEKTDWWNWDHATLKERIEDFKDIRTFIWKYGK